MKMTGFKLLPSIQKEIKILIQFKNINYLFLDMFKKILCSRGTGVEPVARKPGFESRMSTFFFPIIILFLCIFFIFHCAVDSRNCKTMIMAKCYVTITKDYLKLHFRRSQL